MAQLISRPLGSASLPQRPAKSADNLGQVFDTLGNELLFGDRARPMGMAGPPEMPKTLVSEPMSTGAPVQLATPELAAMLEQTAKQHGLDPKVFARIAHIESGGDPRAVTGSYQGLFQLRGGSFDPAENARAGAAKLSNESRAFEARYGRAPTPIELYMIHQQGPGGYAAHAANPDAPAWQNMASTGEGRQKGAGWARQAIWGNVPTQYRSQFGSVDNITSRQFVEMWKRKMGM